MGRGDDWFIMVHFNHEAHEVNEGNDELRSQNDESITNDEF